MALNPLNELKRRLDDDKTPLPKRLCLAKNVVLSHHFPTAPKERIIAEWLYILTEKNSLKTEQLQGVLDWLSGVDDLTGELKSKLIQIVSNYIQKNPLHNTDIQYILQFLENSKITSQLSLQIDHYLTIIVTVLQHLHNTDNTALTQRILNNLIKYYRESKRKFDLIIKLLNGENLETIFSFLDTDCRKSAIDVCQNILFPINKKSYFISFLQTLIRKDNIEELVAEKGDNIQSVIKIMNTFFEFPKNRTDKDTKFLHNFIDVFVSSFHKENQVVFAFYIMVANVLRMEQNFITPAMNLPPIIDENDSKIKRSLCLNLLEVLLNNEVDVNVRLTDTFGEKISKVEIKKNFTSFLQAVMMGQLKLEGKLDKTTLLIIKTALKLDPVLIEQKKQTILPAIITAKKHSSSITECYIDVMNCLLEILFKLSRGTLFISEILPPIKDILEAGNTEQFGLKQKVVEAKSNAEDYEKMESKIITGLDLFPEECVKVYGKLTSELMFRQNKELLESLQKDLEVHCLMMLEEGFVSPSIIVLTEVLSAILSSFLHYNKMADHTVPQNIAEDFWNLYKKFEDECLNKFGQCVLKLSYNPPLILSFLKLCQSFAQLKLLNIKYSNVKLDVSHSTDTLELFDLSDILPCLDKEQWIEFAGSIQEDEAVVILDNLLLTKSIANQLLSIRNNEEIPNETIMSTKTHLIKQINENPSLIQNNYFCKILFTDLDKTQTKQLVKCLIKLHLANPELDLLQLNAITNNRPLLNSLVLETSKYIIKCFENKDCLNKMLNQTVFNMASIAKEIDLMDCFYNATLKPNTDEDIKNYVNIFKQLQIYYLEENYQLVAIFLMLAIKKSCNAKKVKRSIDNVLQSIYELSYQQPDLYQIFPVEFIFSFQDNVLLNLLTLKLKNSNNMLIIKNVLELAVKKVRAESQLVKTIVEKLLKKKKISNMESFNDPVFQITCLILPFIVKQKKAITASAFRSILADLQEKLHKTLLESFKNIDFSNSSISINNADNTEDSTVDNENSVATLNAMAAYSLTLSKYCETTDAEEIKNLDYLWAGLQFFVQNAIKSIENADTKPIHIESSIQLLNVILRHIKKLETHDIFKEKDKILLQIYRSIKARLINEQSKTVLSSTCLEDLGVTLKFVCELATVECYGNQLVADLASLVVLKKPSQITKDGNTDIISRKVFKYLWSQCLKANIVGTKCVAMSKLMHRICKNLRNWIRQHYDIEQGVASTNREISTEDGREMRIVKVEDVIFDLIKLDLDSLSEIILAAKKVSLDYKFVDTIFELQHLTTYILQNKISFDISWDSFFVIYEGCIAVLNSLIVAREEVLEDRWPCYMQCYRALVSSLSERSTSHALLETHVEGKLAEISHTVEKLTQSICKRKKHVSRIAAYTVADLCTFLERNAPSKQVRQHLENSVALLIQASDSSYAMPFLKRALAGSAGQTTMTNLYTMYKRYHKYVGNS